MLHSKQRILTKSFTNVNIYRDPVTSENEGSQSSINGDDDHDDWNN